MQTTRVYSTDGLICQGFSSGRTAGHGLGAQILAPGKATVCTITVNLPDEKEMFRQRLPEDQYQFVEFVERGRPDWLASACRQGVHCDLLVVSGHFDGSTEFYSDQLAASEFLPVVEIERASCSDSGLYVCVRRVAEKTRHQAKLTCGTGRLDATRTVTRCSCRSSARRTKFPSCATPSTVTLVASGSSSPSTSVRLTAM
jgi:hypothetical protein